MANQWFKFYGAEFLSDPKIERLTPQERSCWLTLLCMASQTDDGVVKYLTPQGLLNKSGIYFDPYDTTEWEKTLDVLQTFEQYDMIKVNDLGHIEVKNWVKRQESNLTNAERQAKYRLKQGENENKVKKSNVGHNKSNARIEENRIEENRIDKDRSFSNDRFHEFWSIYPQKVQKKTCVDIWKRKKLDKHTDDIVGFINKAVKSNQWKEGFVPYPSTFLRQERWTDDLSAYESKKKSTVYKNKGSSLVEKIKQKNAI